MAVNSYTQAVERFKKASPWLSDEDAPALVILESLAEQLDSGDTKPATVSQFGLAYRALLKRAPSSDADGDELDGIIKRGRGE